MRDNQIGDVIITKGQRGRNLAEAAVRQSVCVHVSSEAIIENGQAGVLMTPMMH